MQRNNQTNKLFDLLYRNFVIPFCLSSFAVSIFLYGFMFKTESPIVLAVLIIESILVYIIFLSWFKNINRYNNARKIVLDTIMSVFLASILLAIFGHSESLIVFNFSKNTNLVIFLLSLYAGLAILRFEDDKKNSNNVLLSKKQKVTSLLVLLLIICNFLLIATRNLDLLPPQNDEFHTYSAVKYILHDGLKIKDLLYGADNNSSPVFYSRALPYSIGVATLIESIRGSYASVFDLRLLSVILGCFTLFSLYMLFKNSMPKTILLAGIYCFSIFYLFVYHSRVARMYSLVLVIYVALVCLFFVIFNKYLSVESSSTLQNYGKNFSVFLKKNLILICTFLILLFVGIQTHFNTGLIIIPVLLYAFTSSKNKYFKSISAILILLAVVLLTAIFFGIGPVSQNYINQTGQLNLNFVEYLFQYYRSGWVTLLFFLFPIFVYKSLPKVIQFSYFIFISIFVFMLALTNGPQFHDPRYFIFLYPFYTILVVYGIYLMVQSFIKNSTKTVLLITLVATVVIVSKIQIGYTCAENSVFACPISNNSKVFSLDRWNYEFGGAYTTIKSNLTADTLVIGRTLHNYYADKYQIPKEQSCLILSDYTQNKRCTWDDLHQKDILFVVYPELIYTKIEINDFGNMYYYLYRNPNKTLLYESPDTRIRVYKIVNQS